MMNVAFVACLLAVGVYFVVRPVRFDHETSIEVSCDLATTYNSITEIDVNVMKLQTVQSAVIKSNVVDETGQVTESQMDVVEAWPMCSGYNLTVSYTATVTYTPNEEVRLHAVYFRYYEGEMVHTLKALDTFKVVLSMKFEGSSPWFAHKLLPNEMVVDMGLDYMNLLKTSIESSCVSAPTNPASVPEADPEADPDIE